jgi:toxin YoeB
VRKIRFGADAYKQFRDWETINPKIYARINSLINDACNSPFKGIGKPEALKHDLQGYWSRRITAEHRLVYKVTNEAIEVISCKYHYSK